MPSSDNNRIAKNTIYLYIRMGILMIIKFYTSRILIQTLGIDNYGAWIAIAAFIIMFSFVGSPLVTATQRYLNYEMGSGGNNLRDIFCTSLIIFILAAIVLTLILESLGLWFVNNKMTFGIASHRQINIIYQLSILTLILNLIRLPYEAVIIAYEKMSFYAKISIIEGILLLFSVYILRLTDFDSRLVLYGCLSLLSQLIIYIGYRCFCRKNFTCARFKMVFNKKLAKSIGAFSAWNFFGALSSMSAIQGVNVILNLFYGVVYNATYGIANQVHGAVGAIVNNLQKASNPQIIKSYAAYNLDRVYSLVINVGKFSFLLIFIISVPAMLNMSYLLHIWLGNDVPSEAIGFSNLAIIQLLFVCFSAPMDTAVFATGKIKSYQLTLSGIIIMNVILTYVAFKIGYPPITAMYIKAIIEIFVLISRIVYLKFKIGLSLKQYCYKMLLPCFAVIVASLISFYIFIYVYTTNLPQLQYLVVTTLSFLVISLSWIYILVLNKNQKSKIRTLIFSKIRRS